MRTLWGLPLLALCGCQLVFGHQPDPMNLGKDATTVDDAVDAPVDAPTGPAISDGDIDGDGAPNRTDRCPLDGMVSTGGPDGDQDGIGDSCDPNPSSPDCIVLLDAFTVQTPPPLAGWSGVWTHSECDSKLGYCSPPTGGTTILHFDREFRFVNRVDVNLRVIRDFGNGSVELFADLDPTGGGTGRGCGVSRDVGGNALVVLNDILSGAETNVATLNTGQGFSADYDLRWTPPGDSSARDCEVVRQPPGPVSAISGVVAPSGNRRIGFRVADAHVRVHTIIAYATGTCPI